LALTVSMVIASNRGEVEMLDHGNAKTPETEKMHDQTIPPASANGGHAARVADDTGVPQELVYWAIAVGIVLSAAGVASIIITEKAAHLGALTTCVGFGIILAAFGSRAAGGWQKLSATGSGALAIGLFLLYQQYVPSPLKFEKRGQISGDINKIADLRIIDEHPLYNYRDPTTRTIRFIILEKPFKNAQLTIQVDTNENTEGDEFFEMRGDSQSIMDQYFANPRAEVIKWTFDYANKVVKDGNAVLFKVPERLEERQLTDWLKPHASLYRLLAPLGSAFAGPVEPREVPQLIAELRSDNPIVRRNARDELIAVGPEGVKPMMTALHQSSGEYRVKLGVVFALNGMLREETARNGPVARELTDDDLTLLVHAAFDDDQTVRLQAAEFLFRLKDPRVVEPSLQVVRDRRNADAVYTAVVILRPVYRDLDNAEQKRVKTELRTSIPADSVRAQELIQELR
jgi:hypothetical protein